MYNLIIRRYNICLGIFVHNSSLNFFLNSLYIALCTQWHNNVEKLEKEEEALRSPTR